MKTQIQKLYKVNKVSEKMKEMKWDMCKESIPPNGSKQISNWCLGKLIFLECTSVLNAIPVTNVF